MTKNPPTLRQRGKSSIPKNSPPSNYGYTKYGDTKSHPPLSISHFFTVLSLIFVVLIAVIVIEKQLPPGLKIADEHKYPNRFIAERAYNILKNLTALGPRIAGGYINEVLAVELLQDEIKNIIANARDNNVIQMDVQKVSGAFSLEFLDGMTNVYRNMQNVVVKVGSRINSPHSLLLNCHFDTVAESPGGSDDGAGCAVMLEMLRVISLSDRILRHNLIFLFNGGEENFMPASHGFITQHKWAKEVRAFINIEACGAGGREVLFQAGPNHPWILETYSEEVPYPYASSLAQEIFQSGVIPGDTDYRIFRDFGNVSGLDFAWSSNGYVYHTKFDTIDYIPLGTLQRTGDNILALAKGMAEGHYLSEVEHHRAGNLVFFDFLGAFVVRWQMLVSDLINISTVILAIFVIYTNAEEAHASYVISKDKYFGKLLQCMGAIFGSWTASVITAVLTALLLTALGRTMSWYGRPIWLLFLYALPTMFICMAILLFHAQRTQKDIMSSRWTVFQLYYDAYHLIWTVVLIIGIILRIRSSFIALFWVAFPSIGSILKSKVFKNLRDEKWLLLHIGVMGLPFVQCVYLLLSLFYLMIPIMGRVGSGNNSELIMALLMSLTVSLLLNFVVPLILLVHGVERLFSLLVGLFLLSLGVLILTPLGFPYSADPNSLAPQRFMIAHTTRTYHDASGKVADQATGYWIADMDINSPHTVERHVPLMQTAELLDQDCIDHLYCGLPYIVPVQTFIWKTHFIKAPGPHIRSPGTLKIIKRDKIAGGERITVKVGGPNHMGIMMSPVLGVELESWSILDVTPLAGPLWNNRQTYFVYFCYAGEPAPLQFSMDFKIPQNHSGPVLDIAVISHYMFEPEKASAQYSDFIQQFPPWTAVTHWTATYESWII